MANDLADVQGSKIQDTTHTETFPAEVSYARKQYQRNSSMGILSKRLQNLHQRKTYVIVVA